MIEDFIKSGGSIINIDGELYFIEKVSVKNKWSSNDYWDGKRWIIDNENNYYLNIEGYGKINDTYTANSS